MKVYVDETVLALSPLLPNSSKPSIKPVSKLTGSNCSYESSEKQNPQSGRFWRAFMLNLDFVVARYRTDMRFSLDDIVSNSTGYLNIARR
jgi:hypothetical protein